MYKSAIRAKPPLETSDNNDGMDVCLCRFNYNKNIVTGITYAGAGRPLYQKTLGKDSVIVTKGSRKKIGGYQKRDRSNLTFDQVDVAFHAGDVFYLSSDGIADQNDLNRKKIGSPKLLTWIETGANLSVNKQVSAIENKLLQHMGEEYQRDDITFWALKPVTTIK